MHCQKRLFQPSEIPKQGLTRQLFRKRAQLLRFAVGQIQIGFAFLYGANYQNIPTNANQILPENGQVAGSAHGTVNRPQHLGIIARNHSTHQRYGFLPSARTDCFIHQGRGDRLPRPRAKVQKADGVPHTALRKTRNPLCGIRIQLNALRVGNRAQAVGQNRHRDAAKFKALTTGDDRSGQLLQFGGCQDKNNMRGRLLQRFQQGIKRTARKHMHLVDDINAVFESRGRINDRFANRPNVVNAVVGRGIHFHHIGRGTLQHRTAGVAHPAGIAVSRVLAVDGTRQNLGTACLACPARAAEQICVRKIAALHLVLQNRRNMFLSADLTKGSRSPFSI